MDTKSSYHLNDVYGVSRDVPLTYTTRPSVDDRFKADLARDKHLVVHGSSKQGKTCLRKTHLQEIECITIQCTRDLTKPKLYEMLLKRAGISMSVSQSEIVSTTKGMKGTTGAEGGLWVFARAKVEVAGDVSRKDETATATKMFDIDLNDANDIVRVLNAADFTKRVVIEDFHYLDEEVQEAIAFDLKTFHEISKIVFIIVGVWLEANRLVMYNGDLTGRVTTIDADEWSTDELTRVVRSGFPFLNINMMDEVVDAIVSGCQDNVGLLQEVCYHLCESEKVEKTELATREVGSIDKVNEAYREVAKGQASRYINFLARFSEGLTETQYHMYRWIAWVAIHATPSELRHGLRTSTIFQRVVTYHPAKDSLQQNNIAQALERVGKVQFRHKIQPPVLDFSDGRLRVVDVNFVLFLQNQDVATLRETINLDFTPSH